jgi:hypothetical protein
MARLRFIAPGHDHQVCEAFGREFPHRAWVEASDMDPEHLALLAANPTFEADLGVTKGAGEARPAPRRQDELSGKED